MYKRRATRQDMKRLGQANKVPAASEERKIGVKNKSGNGEKKGSRDGEDGTEDTNATWEE